MNSYLLELHKTTILVVHKKQNTGTTVWFPGESYVSWQWELHGSNRRGGRLGRETHRWARKSTCLLTGCMEKPSQVEARREFPDTGSWFHQKFRAKMTAALAGTQRQHKEYHCSQLGDKGTMVNKHPRGLCGTQRLTVGLPRMCRVMCWGAQDSGSPELKTTHFDISCTTEFMSWYLDHVH